MTAPLLAFTVVGAAAPQGSKRHVGHGVMVESSKRVKPWRSDVRDAAMLAMKGAGRRTRQHYDGSWHIRDPLTGPVKVVLEFAYRRPAGHFRRDGQLSATGLRSPYPPARGSNGGDVEKLARALLDALTGIVYEDDGQVVDLHASRVYGPRSQAAVEIYAKEDG